VLRVLGRVPGLRSIRPISGAAVARALLIAAADETPGTRIYGAGELLTMGAAPAASSS